MPESSDLIAIRRGDLDALVSCATRVCGYAKVGSEGVAAGTASFLRDELRLLAARPAMCAKCASDAEENGVCPAHRDEQLIATYELQREADGDLAQAQGWD